MLMAKNRSERERMAEVKTVSGQFTGAYCMHPFTREDIPILLPIMCWQVMAPVQSWRFRLTIAAIMLLQSILI
jgi:hypothetical protein